MNHFFQGILTRPDSYDKEILKEVPKHYCHLDLKDKIVFDIGACFGAFTQYALVRGAKKVYAYEPLPANVELLQKNAETLGWGDKAEIIPKALINRSVPEAVLDLWLVPDSTNYGNPTLIERRGRYAVSVEAVDFHTELQARQPNILKLDCEGAEYELLSTNLPEFVTGLMMEIHFGRQAFIKAAQEMVGDLLLDGWRTVKVPEIRAGLWHTRGAWRR